MQQNMIFTCGQADKQSHTDSYDGSNRTEVKVGQRVPAICQLRPGGGRKYI